MAKSLSVIHSNFPSAFNKKTMINIGRLDIPSEILKMMVTVSNNNSQIISLVRTQWEEKLNPMIFPRVLLLLISGIIRPVTGPAPTAKENIYLETKLLNKHQRRIISQSAKYLIHQAPSYWNTKTIEGRIVYLVCYRENKCMKLTKQFQVLISCG